MAILILTQTKTPPYYVVAKDSRTGKLLRHYRTFDDVGEVMQFANLIRKQIGGRESLDADGFVWEAM